MFATLKRFFQQNSTIQNVKELFTFLEKYSREMSEISWREGDGGNMGPHKYELPTTVLF